MSDIELLWDIQGKIEGRPSVRSATQPPGRSPARSGISARSSKNTYRIPHVSTDVRHYYRVNQLTGPEARFGPYTIVLRVLRHERGRIERNEWQK